MTPKEQALFRCMEIREQIHLRHVAIGELQAEVELLLQEHEEVAKPLNIEGAKLTVVPTKR